MIIKTGNGEIFVPRGKLFRHYRNELKGSSIAYRQILIKQLLFINPEYTSKLLQTKRLNWYNDDVKGRK